MSDSQPRIYVACLASYNGGTLHGAWIDAARTAEELQTAIHEILATSAEPNAEEWAFHDHDGFRGYELDQYEDLQTVSRVAMFIAEHGELGAKLINQSHDVDEATEAFLERYGCDWGSLEAWAENLLDDTGQLAALPSTLRGYFDYERYARDCELGGDIFTINTSDGMVHVFWSH